MDLSLLIFEGIGTQELLLILVIALIVFGPRKLPQLARSFGKGMAEFRRASEDFKRQWEKEVELEEFDKAESSSSHSIFDATVSRDHSLQAAQPEDKSDTSSFGPSEQIASEAPVPEIKEVEPSTMATIPVNENEYTSHEPARKRDWL